jgi:hypothetical protein
VIETSVIQGPRFASDRASGPVRSYKQEAWGGLKRGDVRVDSTNGPNGLVPVPLILPGVLEDALAKLLARHSVLNVRIEERDGYPWLVPIVPQRTPVQILRFADGAPMSEVEAAIGQVVWRPFDLERGPLFRVYAVTYGIESYIGLVAHHFVADISSLRILMGDLLWFYHFNLSRGQASPPPSGLRYEDYLVGLQTWIASPEGCIARQAAVKRVLNLPPLDLGPLLDPEGEEREDVIFDNQSADRLRAAARALSTSPFVVLLAVQNMLLKPFSASSEVGLKVINSGRGASALLRTVGNLADRQYVVTDLGGAQRFSEIAARTHSAFGLSQKYAFVRNDFIQNDLTELGVVGAAPVFNFVSFKPGPSAPPAAPAARAAIRVPSPGLGAATRPRDFYYLVLHDEGPRIRGTIRYGKGHLRGFVREFVATVDRCCRDF